MNILKLLLPRSDCIQFSPLKEKQVEAFFSGRDSFVCLPMGYRKSAMYAVLPKAFNFLLGIILTFK